MMFMILWLFYAIGVSAQPNAEYSAIRHTLWTVVLSSQDSDSHRYVSGWLAKMNTNGQFSDIPYSDIKTGSHTPFMEHGVRLSKMAKAYHTDVIENNWFHNETLAKRIASGYRYITYDAPENQSKNWWNYVVGIPYVIQTGLVIMADQLPLDLIHATLYRFNNLTGVWDPETDGESNAGDNLAARTFLTMSASVLKGEASFQEFHPRYMPYVERALALRQGAYDAGLQPDSCQHQHNIGTGYTAEGWNTFVRHMMYNGGYNGLMTEMARIAFIFHNTSYQMSIASQKALVSSLLDCHQWLSWNTAFEPSSVGRRITNNVAVSQNSAESNEAYRFLLPLGIRTEELEKIPYRFGQRKQTLETGLIGSKQLYSSDLVIHRRLDYMVALRLLSSRTSRPESWQSVNPFNYFMADGLITVFQDGDELGTLYNEVYQYYDWLHIPGTTVEYTGSVPVYRTNRYNLLHNVNNASFVGATATGRLAAAGMIYNRLTVNITAQKAYFFFEDEIVLLATNVEYDSLEYPLHTTLNQVMLKGNVSVRQDKDYVHTFSKGQRQFESPQWLLHDRLAYIFLEGAPSLEVKAETREVTRGSKVTHRDMFEAYVNHGYEPADVEFSYILKPNTDTIAAVDEYMASLPVTVLYNTAYIQAVHHVTESATGAIFYEAENTFVEAPTGTRFSVSHPAIVLIEERKGRPQGQFRIAVTVPNQPGIHLVVTVNRWLIGKDVEYDPNRGQTKIHYTIPPGRYAGKSFKRVYVQQNI